MLEKIFSSVYNCFIVERSDEMKRFDIVTFNLRIFVENDGINNFTNRRNAIIKKIKSHLPLVICFQEAEAESTEFLMENLPEYNIIFNRRNSDLTGEGLATAVLKSDFYILSSDFFWLSDTPRVPGSRFAEQSKLPRITQCLLIQDKKDNKIFRILNTHLDHRKEAAKIFGIKCLLEYAKKQQEFLPSPLFLAGDFNSLPDSEVIKFCKNSGIFDLTTDIPVTFHKFGELLHDNGIKIDYIFASKEIACKSYSTNFWDDNQDGVFLSDHYPVCVTIDF